ncbi:MAG: tail protein X [Eubacteriales bacterium]|nr:tail protein X [Eubacteriales bacterium]
MAGYTKTMSGDTWDAIAHRVLGDAMLMDRMIAANQEYCEVFIFPAGVRLAVPDIEDGGNVTVPPWFAANEE